MVCAFACAGLLLLEACAPAASKGESAEDHFGAVDTQPPRGVEPAAPIAPTAGPRAPAALPFSTGGWKTDFTRYSGSIEEIRSGGPPRDGIPPIDQPRFATPFEA